MADTTTITIPCQWFAMCDNDAVGVVPHPALDVVPTCRRCADRFDLALTECEFQRTGATEVEMVLP